MPAIGRAGGLARVRRGGRTRSSTPAPLGRLDDFITRSGFVITPVVVWAGPARALVANAAEVASIHRIPVSEFMRTDAPWLIAKARTKSRCCACRRRDLDRRTDGGGAVSVPRALYRRAGDAGGALRAAAVRAALARAAAARPCAWGLVSTGCLCENHPHPRGRGGPHVLSQMRQLDEDSARFCAKCGATLATAAAGASEGPAPAPARCAAPRPAAARS